MEGEVTLGRVHGGSCDVFVCLLFGISTSSCDVTIGSNLNHRKGLQMYMKLRYVHPNKSTSTLEGYEAIQNR